MIHILTFFVYCLVWISLIQLTSNDKSSFFKGFYLLVGVAFIICAPIIYLFQLFHYLNFDIIYSIIILIFVGVGLLMAIVKSTNKKEK